MDGPRARFARESRAGERASRAREGVRVVAARPPKGENDGSDNKPKKMLYEVKVVTPPERSLGPHMLPKNTHCGDTIELNNNKYYVVDRVCTHYRLEYGKYRRDHTGLYVQGRRAGTYSTGTSTRSSTARTRPRRRKKARSDARLVLSSLAIITRR